MSKRRRQDYIGCSIAEREGRLRLRFRWGGHPRSRETGFADTPENRKALQPLAKLIAAAIEAGKDPTKVLDEALARPAGPPVDFAAPRPAGPTVSDYFEDWVAQQAAVVRKAQARDYRRHLTGYVLPILGRMLLSDLKASDVRGLQIELLSRGLSVKYVKNIISGSFRAMIRQAKVDDLVTRDIFAGLKWPKWKPPEADPLTPEERARVISWFERKRFGFHAGRASTVYRMLPHPVYLVFVHLLFWSGLRPSEAAGLLWGDIDLTRGRLHVARSRHLYEYGAPKTESVDRWVELFPETVRLLEAIQPLKVTPEMPVFTTTTGTPIEPKAFSRHWYDCLRALGIRQRGLYCTKDTFVTTALNAGVKIAWLETQTGVNYTTLRRHYGKWMPIEGESELRRFEAHDPRLFGGQIVSGSSGPPDTISPSAWKNVRREVRGGGLEPPRVLPH
jgi:integrase